MAELNTSSTEDKPSGKVRSKKAAIRVDLTAMVDLAFLLITFFILTTTLRKSTAMDLIMPVGKQPGAVSDKRTMTILIGSNDKLEWYMGLPDKPLTPPSINNFGKNGLRKTLLEQSIKIKQAQGKDMIVLIKPSDKSNYNDVVSVMDELNIINNQQRAIVDITSMEVGLLKRDKIYN